MDEKFWETTDEDMEELVGRLGSVSSNNKSEVFLAQILCELHEIKNLLKKEVK